MANRCVSSFCPLPEVFVLLRPIKVSAGYTPFGFPGMPCIPTRRSTQANLNPDLFIHLSMKCDKLYILQNK